MAQQLVQSALCENYTYSSVEFVTLFVCLLTFRTWSGVDSSSKSAATGGYGTYYRAAYTSCVIHACSYTSSEKVDPQKCITNTFIVNIDIIFFFILKLIRARSCRNGCTR